MLEIRTDIPTGSIPRFDTRMSRHYARRLMYELTPELLNDRVRADGRRADSLTAAFARQLEYIYKEVFEIEYAKLRAPDFIPVSTEVPQGSLTFTYRMWDKKGRARIIHNFSSDLPKADVVAKEFPSPVIWVGDSYGYSIGDLQRAAMTNAPLEQLKANAARWAIEQLAEEIACAGSAQDGVPGLINAPGIVGTTPIASSGWITLINSIGAATPSQPASAVAAVQQIASDVNAMKNKIRTATLGLHDPDTCLLPTPLYTALDTAPRSPAFTDDTFLDYLRKLTKMNFDYWPQLDDKGSDGLGRVMVYEKDPEVLRLILAQPFTQTPPQPRQLAWEIPCYAQYGGVMVIRPQAVTYMDTRNT